MFYIIAQIDRQNQLNNGNNCHELRTASTLSKEPNSSNSESSSHSHREIFSAELSSKFESTLTEAFNIFSELNNSPAIKNCSQTEKEQIYRVIAMIHSGNEQNEVFRASKQISELFERSCKRLMEVLEIIYPQTRSVTINNEALNSKANKYFEANEKNLLTKALHFMQAVSKLQSISNSKPNESDNHDTIILLFKLFAKYFLHQHKKEMHLIKLFASLPPSTISKKFAEHLISLTGKLAQISEQSHFETKSLFLKVLLKCFFVK